METTQRDGRASAWKHRALNNPHRPNPVNVIPEQLHELGEVLFPLPREKKAWRYPHHMQEYRYGYDSEILNAYLEAGWGYGISCANDIAVIDIDDLNVVDEIVNNLPETCWQYSGSREGIHLFYKCPGLDNRVVLHKEVEHDCSNEEHSCKLDLDGVCQRETDWDHIGEIKCDPHGYVIGAGSVHPSGNKYGPLNGDSITKVDKETVEEAVGDYVKVQETTQTQQKTYDPDVVSDVHEFYELSASDVMPGMQPGVRTSHPVHGSSTGSNFMLNEDGETFTCWRCTYGSGQGCGLGGTQYLAVEATGMDCDVIRSRWNEDTTLHYKAWNLAVDKGLIGHTDIPYTVAHGYAVMEGCIEPEDKLQGDLYFDVMKGISYEKEQELRGEPP